MSSGQAGAWPSLSIAALRRRRFTLIFVIVGALFHSESVWDPTENRRWQAEQPAAAATRRPRRDDGGDGMAYFLSPSLPLRPRRWAQYMNQQLSPPSLPSFLPHDALYKAFPDGIQNLRGCCRLLLSYSNFCQFGNQTI